MAINAGDTVPWSWSSPSLVTGVSYQVVQVSDAASTTQIGFSSGNSTSIGIQFLFLISKEIVLNKRFFIYFKDHIRINLIHPELITYGLAM